MTLTKQIEEQLNALPSEKQQEALDFIAFIQHRASNGTGGSELQASLTRIVALSWRHGGTTTLDLKLDGRHQKGVMISFGKSILGDGGLVQVELGSLDTETFQIFVESFNTDSGCGFWTNRRIEPDAVLPVMPVMSPDGLVTQANSTSGPEASAAALILSNAAFQYVQYKKLRILIKGDFILDETRQRAIDVRFLRTELPTGTYLHDATLGVQGGQFESWTWIGQMVNLNTATFIELRTLPRIGPTLAKRIIESRHDTKGGFKNIEDLQIVSGIGPDLIIQLKPFITV